jgi:cell division transport system ATP-binding protein
MSSLFKTSLEKRSEIQGELPSCSSAPSLSHYPVSDMPEPDDVLLELDQVSKVFEKNLRALDGISFRMVKGEFLFIVGPNLAGKTTLLKLITSEEKPTEGKVVFDGFDSRKMKRKQLPLLRRKMGRILQDFRLINDMNVFDNLALALRILGGKERSIKDKVGEVLEMVGLPGKGRSFPASLSSAEEQKAVIARAIIKDPLLLLADEPTLNLDEESSEEIMKLLKQINLLGTAVLVTTHDYRWGGEKSARIIEMREGRFI